jgi:hypothetical protein
LAELKKRRYQALGALYEQLQRAKAAVASAEAALRAFRVRSATSLAMSNNGQIDTRDPSANRFFNARVTLEQVQEDRQVIRRVLTEAADSGIQPGNLENIPSVQRSSILIAALRELTGAQAELRALRYRYTDEQPAVRRLLAGSRTCRNAPFRSRPRRSMPRSWRRKTICGNRSTVARRRWRPFPHWPSTTSASIAIGRPPSRPWPACSSNTIRFGWPKSARSPT